MNILTTLLRAGSDADVEWFNMVRDPDVPLSHHIACNLLSRGWSGTM